MRVSIICAHGAAVLALASTHAYASASDTAPLVPVAVPLVFDMRSDVDGVTGRPHKGLLTDIFFHGGFHGGGFRAGGGFRGGRFARGGFHQNVVVNRNVSVRGYRGGYGYGWGGAAAGAAVGLGVGAAAGAAAASSSYPAPYYPYGYPY